MQHSEAFRLSGQNSQEPCEAQGLVNQLKEKTTLSYKAFLEGNIEKAKFDLDDALFCLFLAYKRLGLNPERTISRQIKQIEKKNHQARKNHKVMLIKSNKVEIIVNGVAKGKWSIWDNQDIEYAKKIANDFGIKVIEENS